MQTLAYIDVGTELQLYLFTVLSVLMWLTRGALDRADEALQRARAVAAKRAERINAEMDDKLSVQHYPVQPEVPGRYYAAFLVPIGLAALAAETVHVIYRLSFPALETAAKLAQ